MWGIGLGLCVWSSEDSWVFGVEGLEFRVLGFVFSD